LAVWRSGFRFGFSGSGFGSVDEVVDAAERAERAGFDSFVLADLPGALSPLITLAAVARATTTIGLAPFVLNTGLWNPATVARDLATLDRLRGYAGDRGGQLEVGTGAAVIVTDDAHRAAEKLAAIHTYLTPAQIRSSPKILIGTAGEIAAQILDRGKRLGLTYQVLRGADPEILADVIAQVQGDSGH
jgi:alkanesulfonate monooxygenase SsuD/methylene tetrahydromethanopterin reductase-like flavin-dependent oxidoreductase (luciferase family)